MDASGYLWHQQKQGHDNVHNGLAPSVSSSNSNGRSASDQHGHGGQQWEHGYGYTNGSAATNGSQGVPQSIPQTYYDPGGWNLYDDFTAPVPSSGAMGISPAALLAQRAPNGTPQNQGSVMDAPTTIDPTLMMTSPFPQYVSPQHTQYSQHSHSHSHSQLQHTSSYQNRPQPSYLAMTGTDSSLSAMVNYEPPTQMSPTPPTPSSTLPINSHSTAGSAPPLIDQVKKLLTPKLLDRDPQSSAQKLIDLLLQPGDGKSAASAAAGVPPTTDKDTRTEVLTRLRDHAPKEFFVVFARNAAALGLLREWGKNACKKEEFEETLMGWLQVVDKLPLTVDALAQSGLGKLIKYVVEHPPTTAIRDMAAKIESGWKKVIASKQQDIKPEPETRPKKRKLETTSAPTKATSTGASTGGAASTAPATKKAAVVNAAGTRVAVRKDSVNSPITSTFSNTAGAATASSASATNAAPKGAQSDSGFFSAKPKQKLPSFRKKPLVSPSTPAGGSASSTTASGGNATTDTAGAAMTSYSNPFEDAMKSLRKSSDSPALPNQVSSGNTIVSGVSTPPGISVKTGRPKKVVRFNDVELEKIKFIEKAIYDDDVPGAGGFHGQSYRDLDRAEGNLLKHMVAQIEWFEPPPLNLSHIENMPQRGERSKEATTQSEREVSALAAFYQGAPPDTPVEPPQLASLPLTADDSGVKLMLLGHYIDEVIQGGQQDAVMTAGHWLGQLGMDGSAGGYGAATGAAYGAIPIQNTPPVGTHPPAPGQEGITDILNKLMKVVGQPDNTTPAPGPQPQYGSTPYGVNSAAAYPQNPPPASGVDNTALLSALTALGMIPAPQPSGEYSDATGYGGASYGDASQYGPAAVNRAYGSTAPAVNGLPPPLGMPLRDEQEDRWRRSAKGDAAGGAKRGKRKDVPASQNTWKPLCTFFARGKCRFGEDCDFSHDPSKLPK